MDKLLLTGKIANFESEIDTLKEEQTSIQNKLKIAYDYKDNIFNQNKLADDNIKKLQVEYFQKTQEIISVVDKIKSELEIYTNSFL